ncbi:MAG: glycosyltransferase [Proteobacteria bacterium]|nr:glycosyltransferase [Pseudomonadota bacterium]
MISYGNMLWLIHMAALLGLVLYGMHRIWLLILWKKIRQDSSNGFFLPEMDKDPRVTIQLPLYNERFVVKRLIDAASNLDWPKDCLEIQVLDDSSDETRALVDERVLYWQGRGVDIKAIRRKDRNGFKAGALAFGMASAKGEFIAVFDADFVPGKDFLRRTVSCFTDAKIGMVQCRWAFLNEEHSWLTRIQGVLLSAHFRIEHHVRHQYGLCFNFNGTAGIWRKAVIVDAGGFQADTVTEDLDISYRAQLKGWRFVYLDDYAVPSELPTTMAAFRTQQKRWTKGSIQTARKLLPLIFASKIMTPLAKLEAFAHLLSNTGWLLCMVLTLTLYPAVQINETVVSANLLQVELLLFLFSSGAVLLYFFIYAVTFEASSKWVLPLIPVLSIGMAPVLSLSVISGMLTKGGIFHRTPKYSVLGRSQLPGLSLIYKERSTGAMMINIPIFLYTLLPVWFLWQTQKLSVVFPLLFPLGFIWVILKDFQDALTSRNDYILNKKDHSP